MESNTRCIIGRTCSWPWASDKSKTAARGGISQRLERTVEIELNICAGLLVVGVAKAKILLLDTNQCGRLETQ